MENAIIKPNMQNTTVSQNNEPIGQNEQLLATNLTQVAEHLKATEKTWITLSPFQKEEVLLRAILEWYPSQQTAASPETKTEV